MLTGKVRPTRSITLDSLLDTGFVMLSEDEPRELVMGAVGKFWRPDSGIIRITPQEFSSFDQAGFAKAVMVLTVEEKGTTGSLLATETRVSCTDESARRRFLLYWRAIGPFSGLIRHLMLRQIKAAAESATALAQSPS